MTGMGKKRELRTCKSILAKEDALELALFHGRQARRVESPGEMKAPVACLGRTTGGKVGIEV
jgi:hypothetical protein